MAVQQPRQPVDPPMEQAVQRLAEVVAKAFEQQQGGAIQAFEKLLMEYGARLSPEEPSIETIWTNIRGNPVVWVDATYLLLRDGLGRKGPTMNTLVVQIEKDGIRVTAPSATAIGVACLSVHGGTVDYKVLQWPHNELSLLLSPELAGDTVFTFDSRRITGVGVLPPAPPAAA